MIIDFNKDRHTYLIDGKPAPSISKIIRVGGFVNFSGVSKEIMERAQKFGSAVHKACELHDLDDLDYDTLAGDLVPYLDGWKSYVSDSGLEIIDVETPVGSKIWNVAGTPDIFGKIGRDYAIIDRKSTASFNPSVQIQTAGYKICKEEMLGIKIKRRIAVLLLPNGKYRPYNLDDPIDEIVFKGAVNGYRWKQKYMKGEIK